MSIIKRTLNLTIQLLVVFALIVWTNSIDLTVISISEVIETLILIAFAFSVVVELCQRNQDAFVKMQTFMFGMFTIFTSLHLIVLYYDEEILSWQLLDLKVLNLLTVIYIAVSLVVFVTYKSKAWYESSEYKQPGLENRIRKFYVFSNRCIFANNLICISLILCYMLDLSFPLIPAISYATSITLAYTIWLSLNVYGMRLSLYSKFNKYLGFTAFALSCSSTKARHLSRFNMIKDSVIIVTLYSVWFLHYMIIGVNGRTLSTQQYIVVGVVLIGLCCFNLGRWDTVINRVKNRCTGARK